MTPEPEYLSLADVARRFGKSRVTAQRWVASGKLPAVHPLGVGQGKPVMVPAAAVEALARELAAKTTR